MGNPNAEAKAEISPVNNQANINEPSRTSEDLDIGVIESKEQYVRDSQITPDGGDPTEEECETLKKISGKLPWSTFLIAAVEFCERFAYYGLSGPFQNYMENDKHSTNPRGAIGLGQSGATGLSNYFQFWCYVTPILGAIIADQYIGKLNAIIIFASVYICGLVVLFVTSLPVSINHGGALPGLVIAMTVIGLGTGGIKSNIAPLIAEQTKATKRTVKTLATGERVIIDPARTIERVCKSIDSHTYAYRAFCANTTLDMIFYLCINIGSLGAIATTELELHIGFWAAFLLPLIMFCIGFAVLIMGRKRYVVKKPTGSIVFLAFKAIYMAIKGKFKFDVAKPSYQRQLGNNTPLPWDDVFIDELKRTMVACKVFVYYPIYYLCYQQMLNNFISQAGTMELHGMPNDIMQNIDPLTIIIFIPIIDRLVFPFIRKRFGVAIKPITRITLGFFFIAVAMAYAAIVQHLIYTSPPCYRFPKSSECLGGEVPNKVHVVVQTPAYFFVAISEIFASVTGMEYAFTKAPESMKSFVMSMFLLTNAFAAAVGIGLSRAAKHPHLHWLYTALACASVAAGTVFWLLYSQYNKTEDTMNAIMRPENSQSDTVNDPIDSEKRAEDPSK
ncbi:peptide transporter ptr2 [Ascosphaera aggregata]|nr:peptide transporter ptr2 [Ascosphaera aggregata]